MKILSILQKIQVIWPLLTTFAETIVGLFAAKDKDGDEKAARLGQVKELLSREGVPDDVRHQAHALLDQEISRTAHVTTALDLAAATVDQVFTEAQTRAG